MKIQIMTCVTAAAGFLAAEPEDTGTILARLGEADARVGRVIATYEGSVKDGHLTAVIARDRDAGIQAMRVDAKSARGEIRLMALLDGDGDLFMPVSTVGEVARIKGVGQWLDELGGWMAKVFGGLGDWEGGDKVSPGTGVALPAHHHQPFTWIVEMNIFRRPTCWPRSCRTRIGCVRSGWR